MSHDQMAGTRCYVCRKLNLKGSDDPKNVGEEWEDRNWEYMWVNRTSLEEAADQGCRFCTLIIRGLIAYLEDTPFERVHVLSTGIPDESSKHWRRDSLRVNALDKGGHLVTGLEVYTDDPRVCARWPSLTISSHVSEHSSSSTAYLEPALQWLNQCLDAHVPNLCPRTTNIHLPTRVIDVRDRSGTIRLLNVAADMKGTYVALSYCWGKGKTFKTTKQNYRSLQEGFALQRLPKTCYDAVIVTRALGIPYLWIDQLCIIQDSKSDWELESSRMCSVYSNACITLAALDSVACDDGLFLPSLGWRTVKLDSGLEDCEKASVFVRGQPFAETMSSAVHRQRKLPGSSFHDNALNSRGWTLQELLLSPRILWFGNTELAWTCMRARACECEPALGPLHDYNARYDGTAVSLSLISDRQSIRHMPTDHEQRMNLWQDIVVEFSMRYLTIPHDRLPALAGLAAAFLKHDYNDQYMAGLWKRHLALQLLWVSQSKFDVSSEARKETFLQMTSPEYCPTWSWCSAFGVVQWRPSYTEGTREMSWTILDAQYCPVGLNPFGPGTGIVTIDGWLLPLEFVDDQFLLKDETDSGDASMMFCEEWHFVMDVRPTSSDLRALSDMRIYFVLAEWAKSSESGEECTECWGLLLELVSSESMQYHRLGRMHAEIPDVNGKSGWEEHWVPHCTRSTVLLM